MHSKPNLKLICKAFYYLNLKFSFWSTLLQTLTLHDLHVQKSYSLLRDQCKYVKDVIIIKNTQKNWEKQMIKNLSF